MPETWSVSWLITALVLILFSVIFGLIAFMCHTEQKKLLMRNRFMLAESWFKLKLGCVAVSALCCGGCLSSLYFVWN